MRRPGPARRPHSIYEEPFVWWASHPWAVVWLGIVATPFVVLATRILDEQGFVAAENVLRWGGFGLFVIALFLGLLVSGRHSPARAAAGGAAAALVMILVVLFLYQVTLGQTACPPRAGKDIGSTVATRLLDGWKQGYPTTDLWEDGEVDSSWTNRTRTLTLLDYERPESGCWEHFAPVSARRTWHDFRVMIRTGGNDSIAKNLRVNTINADGDWRVTSVEGPWP